MTIRTRWMIRVDMEQVLEIEQLCFQYAWTELDFSHELRRRCCIGLACVKPTGEQTDEVLGFMIYELFPKHLRILNLAVHPSCWGRGVGSMLLDKLKSKLSQQRRTAIKAMVRESNVGAQAFFAAEGFRVSETIRQPFEETDEDGYEFRYAVPVMARNEYGP